MEFPDNILYTKEHEWVQVEGKIAKVGLTDYAQQQLGDIVFVELPAKNLTLSKGSTFGVVESVKSVSDCYAPLSGKVIDTNESLVDEPAIINEDPFGEGWMIKLEISNEAEVSKLLKPADYKTYVEEESA